MGKDNKLAFVLMLDTSGSMINCIDMVKIDAKAFVRMARKDDQFAINRFASEASWVYPDTKNPKLLTVSSDLNETKKALDYIEKITAGGNTAMGDAIRLGNAIMKESTVTADLCAYVILSDGQHNWGSDPTVVLGETPPVYIAALGHISEKYFNQLTQKNSKSKLYNQPNAYKMMMMFNQIIADSNDNELILNELDQYQKGADYVLKTFQVSSADNAAQVNVVWSDKNYKYTSGIPGGNAINVVLIDPDNNNTNIEPDISENGYCIYNLENVKPGTWKILIQYSVPTAITGTVGGVDFYTDIKTNMLLPAGAGTDGPMDIRVTALNGDAVLDNVRVTAQLSQPVMSEADIKEQYAGKLDAIMQEDSNTDEEKHSSAVLEKLRSEVLKTENKDIFAKQVSTHTLTLSKDGEYIVQLDGINKSGICNVDIRIEGVNPKTNLPFTRFKSGAFWVE